MEDLEELKPNNTESNLNACGTNMKLLSRMQQKNTHIIVKLINNVDIITLEEKR